MKKIFYLLSLTIILSACGEETAIQLSNDDTELELNSYQDAVAEEVETETVDEEEIYDDTTDEESYAKAYEADRIAKDALREEKKLIDAEIQKDPSVEQPKYITTIQTLYQEEVGLKIKEEVAKIWENDPNKQSEMYTEYLMDYFELNDLEITYTDQYYIMEEAFEIHGYNFEMVKFSYENGMDEYFGLN
ncbi:TPA: membrane lipoprotein lipid attachment site-containing protein [Salmonella enterica subsp. enterica serovar Typhi str. AG3]|nr:membrane lipoprotein lipid attachment site-containing protein [Salmonella enterica subsp. enterica serovar Typhi str. AG3]